MLTFSDDMKICIDQEIGDFFDREQFFKELEYAFCYSQITKKYYDVVITNYRIYNSSEGKKYYFFKGYLGDNVEYHAFRVSKMRYDVSEPFFNGIRWAPIFSLSKIKQVFFLTDF